MPQLHLVHDKRDVLVHPLLDGGRVLIGRSDQCDLAIPSEAVSRVHCLVERRADGWWVTDRSKHGTRVNGTRVERIALNDGDLINLGRWDLRFVSAHSEAQRATTSTTPLQLAPCDELVEADESQHARGRATLLRALPDGRRETLVLSRARVTLGGPGSHVVLGPDLPPDAAVLRVVRGRVLVEPGALLPYLEGARVRELTPALQGETLRIGDVELSIGGTHVDASEAEQSGFGDMIGVAPAMRKLFGSLHRMAKHDAPVLVTGESGTGKEVAARGLHSESPRSAGPFVALNAAAVTEQLAESELFGHERGAFTGATQRQDGAFQRADGGTLFLDEIGELKLELQAKLLRALESGEVRRVGGSKPDFPDVRVVAATNRNLVTMVREGSFREDLYFRLAVLTVRLPPLRERLPDLVPLARSLLARHHPEARLTPDAEAALTEYHWPGNVRELRNVLTRAVVLGGTRVDASSLTFNPWAFYDQPAEPRNWSRTVDERALIEAALARTDNNKSAAAKELGMPRSSLLYKLKRYGMMA